MSTVLFLCHNFHLITLVHVLVSSYDHQTAKGVCESIREAFFFWMRVVKKIKFAAFYSLDLKSNIFEKIKYAQEKEIPRHFQHK